MTVVTQKRHDKKGYFSLRTGPIHNFFTYARHDEPGGPVINSDIIKSTPKIRHQFFKKVTS